MVIVVEVEGKVKELIMKVSGGSLLKLISSYCLLPFWR